MPHKSQKNHNPLNQPERNTHTHKKSWLSFEDLAADFHKKKTNHGAKWTQSLHRLFHPLQDLAMLFKGCLEITITVCWFCGGCSDLLDCTASSRNVTHHWKRGGSFATICKWDGHRVNLLYGDCGTGKGNPKHVIPRYASLDVHRATQRDIVGDIQRSS